MYLIKLTNFDREILNPALAIASTLSDASTVLNDLVLRSEHTKSVLRWNINRELEIS